METQETVFSGPAASHAGIASRRESKEEGHESVNVQQVHGEIILLVRGAPFELQVVLSLPPLLLNDGSKMLSICKREGDNFHARLGSRISSRPISQHIGFQPGRSV